MKKRYTTWFILTAVITLFSVIIVYQNSVQYSTSNEPLSVGFVDTGITGMIVRLINDESLYRDISGQLEFIGFSNPSGLNNALIYNKIDVAMATGSNVVALAREKGFDVKYFFPNVLNTVSLLSKKTSGISTLDDLKGKRIGWYGLPTSGGTGFYLLAQAHGYEPDIDFQLIHAKPPVLLPLLSKGDVDAIIIFEPFVSRLLSSDEYIEVLGPFWKEWEESNGYPLELSGYAANSMWLNDHPVLAKELITIWINAAKLFQEKPYYYTNKYHDLLGLSTENAIRMAAGRIADTLIVAWGEMEYSIEETQSKLYEKRIMLTKPPASVIVKLP